MRQPGVRRRSVLLSLALVVLLVRGWAEVVPWGVSPRSLTTFFGARGTEVVLLSPSATNRVTVIVNDAGAMHSGNHYTWALAYDRLTGWRVVTAGYIDAAEYVETRRVPLRWLTDEEIETTFCEGRRQCALVVSKCRVN